MLLLFFRQVCDNYCFNIECNLFCLSIQYIYIYNAQSHRFYFALQNSHANSSVLFFQNVVPPRTIDVTLKDTAANSRSFFDLGKK